MKSLVLGWIFLGFFGWKKPWNGDRLDLPDEHQDGSPRSPPGRPREPMNKNKNKNKKEKQKRLRNDCLLRTFRSRRSMKVSMPWPFLLLGLGWFPFFSSSFWTNRIPSNQFRPIWHHVHAPLRNICCSPSIPGAHGCPQDLVPCGSRSCSTPCGWPGRLLEPLSMREYLQLAMLVQLGVRLARRRRNFGLNFGWNFASLK